MDASSRVESIPGWLRPEDAEKLYELALASTGAVLEVGTHHGKSAILMALALKARQRDDALLYTVDVDRQSLAAARAEALARGVGDTIVFVRGTLRALAAAYPQLRPTLTFVDGDHTYEGVRRDLEVLEKLVPSGGSIVFHDFADPRNADPNCPDTKVRPAVEASWVARECDFEGAFGVCGLFIRRGPLPATDAPAMIDLLPLEAAADQFHWRVRYPAAKLLRRLRGSRR